MRGHRGRYPLLADEDLISRVGGGGGAQALALLYDRHSRAAFSLAYRMMGERQASEDLAQDALISVGLKSAAVGVALLLGVALLDSSCIYRWGP